MAGSITVTTSTLDGSGGVGKYSIAWVSDGSGDVDTTTFELPSGTIVGVEFIPDSGGTQPTDLYDVTMLDSNSINILDDGGGTSVGADLSNSTSTWHVPHVPSGTVRRWVEAGDYQPVVANAGASKGGTINVYVAPVVF